MAQGSPAPALPSEAEAKLAKESSRVLASRMRTAAPLRLRMLDDPAKETVKIPASAVRMLIQLLDEGKIEFRRVGTHRRVRFESLLAHKRRADEDRRAVLAELAAYDQELGI